MILLNFSHPLTSAHLSQVQDLASQPVERVIEIRCRIDAEQPLAPQVRALADEARLSAEEWQSLPILVNPPSLNYIAAALLAELHGRCGYFPAMLRLRPAPNGTPPRYEVAEIVNLQAVRDEARRRR